MSKTGQGKKIPIPTLQRKEAPSLGTMPNYGNSADLKTGKVVVETPPCNLKVPRR